MNNPERTRLITTPFPGRPLLCLHWGDRHLKRVEICLTEGAPACPSITPGMPQTGSDTLPELRALLDYLHSGHWSFKDYPLPKGTPFQQRVWSALQHIPAGEVRRYGQLAAELGSSARAVANACRANPLPIIIPCHRVISARGIGGYMGATTGQAAAIKRWLLHHEAHASRDGR